jgi:polar amino acid transport system substrate-binding protein
MSTATHARPVAGPVRRLATAAIAVVVGALTLAACANPDGAWDLGLQPTAEATTATPAPTSTTTTAPAQCDDPTASYPALDALPAPDALPAGSTMAAIRERGVLIVGVSSDTLLMGSRNPLTGQIEGFDIDMARDVAEAILGDPDKIQFRVITASQRIPVLTDHEVDLVARAFSITCDRWTQIAFSTEYLHSGQKVLVTTDSTATGLSDLPSGSKVCAPSGTTTIKRLADYPNVEAVPAATHTACLALFQQGQVDAITGDDTVLAGLASQDPHAKVVGEAISDEPYGLGMAPDQVDLVQFVNTVLEQVKADGRWTASYDRWLSALGAAPAPPVAVFGR